MAISSSKVRLLGKDATDMIDVTPNYLPKYERSYRQINVYNEFFNPTDCEQEILVEPNNPYSLRAFSDQYLRVGIEQREHNEWDSVSGILTISDPYVFYCRRTVLSPSGVLFDRTLSPIREALNTYLDIDKFLNGQPKTPEAFVQAWFSKSTFERSLLHARYLLKKKTRRIPPLRHVEKPVLLFFDHYYYNFTHFLVEAFPRLYALKEQLAEFTPVLPIRLSDENQPENSFITACLASIGVSPNSGVNLDRKSYYSFDRVLLPSQMKMHPQYVVPAIEHLSEFFRNPKSSIGSKRIYISRENAAGRKVQNEEAVTETLRRYGFVKVVMENRSFEEKIAIMRQARVLVCSDGSSVTNSIFMPRNAKILAFRPDIFPNFNLALAALFRHRFRFQVCTFATPNHSWSTGAIRVDIPTLERNLESFLQ